jgi:hypothetical protein
VFFKDTLRHEKQDSVVSGYAFVYMGLAVNHRYLTGKYADEGCSGRLGRYQRLNEREVCLYNP